jgi:ureidoacrylate peracid hydrolase
MSGLGTEPLPTKSRVVTVDARPEAITMDTAKTAVIVVDMQNDFGSKRGMFDRSGHDISVIQNVVGQTAKVLAFTKPT